MKKKLILAICIAACAMLLAITASATSVIPQKPTLDVDFGSVTTIDGFIAPSDKFTTTERVLLTDGNGNYVTYPTYYITKDSTTFDLDFDNLNAATGITYSKASVAMLEVPNGITEMTQRYFNDSQFTSCVSVQIPGSVTTYGKQLFFRNMTVRIVEFLDGTEPVTMGDGMFAGDNTGGSRGTAVEYVKFPNNLVSLGSGTFYKNKVSKTIILGKNLESIAAPLFNESCPRDKDTFIYVSDKFFSTSDAVEKLFGGEAPYHGNNLRITLFYAGSQAQAEALVGKFTEVANCLPFDKTTYVNANSYDYATHKPSSDKSMTLVYGVDSCEAFYGGHIYEGTGLCVDGFDCKNCDKAIAGTTGHEYVKTATYANGYTQEGLYSVTCSNEDCKLSEKTVLAPIFSALEENGYSTNGTGIAFGGYTIDTNALAEYNRIQKANGESTLTFGVAIMNPKYVGESFFVDGAANSTQGFIVADLSDTEYSNVKVMIDGLAAHVDLELVIALYAYTDSADVEFIQSADTNSACSKVEKNDATLYTVSLNSVSAKAGTSLDALPPFGKENA